MFEYGYTSQITPDGGYIIGGTTGSFATHGQQDMYLIRLNGAGDTLWSRIIGTSGTDVVNDIWCTSDGGFLFTGYNYAPTTKTNAAYIVKTDSLGDTAWTRSLLLGDGYATMQSRTGKYLVAGYTSEKGAGGIDAYLVALDANGVTLWSREYGGKGTDWIYGIDETSDGGFILGGYTTSFAFGTADTGHSHIYIVRTDSNGEMLWSRVYGGDSTEDAFGHSVHQTADGGFIIGGVTNSFGAGGQDCYLTKTDAQGNIQWSKTFGGSADETGHCVRQTPDHGYIISGWTNSFGNGVANKAQNCYLVRADSNGTLLWSRTYGGAGLATGIHPGEGGYDVHPTSDGGYFIVGYANSYGAGSEDALVVKTDAAGNSGCDETTPATITRDAATKTFVPQTATNSGSAMINPQTFVSRGVDVGTQCSSVGVFVPEKNIADNIVMMQNYPNPFSSSTIISYSLPESAPVTLRIYNSLGEEISTLVNGEMDAGQHNVEFRSENLQNGMYFYRLTAGTISQGGGMAVIH